MNWIIMTLLWSCFVGFAKTCHYYRVRDVYKKRRDLTNHIQDTHHLREYFTRCMTQQSIGVEGLDWDSNVDFTILDSVWFDNTEQVYCSAANGGGTSECWKGAMERFLVEDNTKMLQRAQLCVSHYAEDTNFNPPQDRYARSRTKRQSMLFSSFTSSRQTIDTPAPLQRGSRYSRCLDKSVVLPSERAPLNYNALSRFVERYVRDGRCSVQEQYPVTWPFRFVAITRADSPLRGALRICAAGEIPEGYFWSSWSRWEQCTSTCGMGMQIRRRSCRLKKNPSQIVPAGCQGGSRFEGRTCRNPSCQPQPRYHWGPWVASPCSRTCGEGIQMRTRVCMHERGSESPLSFCHSNAGGDSHHQRCIVEECSQNNWFDPPPQPSATFQEYDDNRK